MKTNPHLCLQSARRAILATGILCACSGGVWAQDGSDAPPPPEVRITPPNPEWEEWHKAQQRGGGANGECGEAPTFVDYSYLSESLPPEPASGEAETEAASSADVQPESGCFLKRWWNRLFHKAPPPETAATP